LMESLHGQLRDLGSKVRAAVLFPPLTATHLSGNPEVMKMVEGKLRAKGVPSTLVAPDQVAGLLLDGIRRDRFFIRVGKRESAEFFDGAISDEYLEWTDRMVSGRSDAMQVDGRPDGYLW